MKKHLHYLLFTLFFFLGSSYTFAQTRGTSNKGIWKTIQLPASFESRDWAATAWTGTEFLYWGGSSTDGRPADWKKTKAKGRYVPNNGFYFTDGWRINPTTGTCKPMPPSGLPIGFYNSVWTGRYLFVFNGRYMRMKMYDAQKNTWKAISRVRLPRFQRMNLAVNWTGKEVMIWGGTNYQHTKFYNDGYLYNPETNRWRKMAPSPLISRGSPISFNTNKEIIIYGGDHNKYLNNGAAYNPTTNTWRKIANNPYHKGHFFETKVWTGKECSFFARRSFAYNPVTNTWRKLAIKHNADMTSNFNTWDGKKYLYQISKYGQKYKGKNTRWNLDTMKEEPLPVSPIAVHDIATCVWLKGVQGLLIIVNSRYASRKAFFYKP